MKFDFKGNCFQATPIQDFINFIEQVDDNQIWLYQGLKVTIDPTVDFDNHNVLIRWLDVEEGFNDKLILSSLKDFQGQFKSLN